MANKFTLQLFRNDSVFAATSKAQAKEKFKAVFSAPNVVLKDGELVLFKYKVNSGAVDSMVGVKIGDSYKIFDSEAEATAVIGKLGLSTVGNTDGKFIYSVGQTNGQLSATSQTFADNLNSAIAPKGTTVRDALADKAAATHTHSISEITDLQTKLNGKAAATHTHSISEITDLQTKLNGKSDNGHKHEMSAINGLSDALAGKAATKHNHVMDNITDLPDWIKNNSTIPANNLPSYVDDVIEAASFSALPKTGESGKIYVTTDTNKTYRWATSQYIEISASIVYDIATASTAGLIKSGGDITVNSSSGLVTVNGKASATDLAATNKRVSTLENNKSDKGHTHSISEITDLQTKLNGKAAATHTHSISEITDLQTKLNGKAAATHTHSISEITGLQDKLDNKLEKTTVATQSTLGLIKSGGDITVNSSSGLVTVNGKASATDLAATNKRVGTLEDNVKKLLGITTIDCGTFVFS